MIGEAKFNRFSIAVSDFEKARDFLKEAKDHQNGSLVHEALVFSAIVCYFRPFTSNEKDQNSRAVSMLELSDSKPFSRDESDIHETCKDLRTKALAHAEIGHHPTRLHADTSIISSAIFSLVGKAPNSGVLQDLIDSFIWQCHNTRADYVRSVRAP